MNEITRKRDISSSCGVGAEYSFGADISSEWSGSASCCPRQVVKPLLDLKEAVDQAASGDFLIDFEVRGEGEVVEVAKSVRKLIAYTLDVASRPAAAALRLARGRCEAEDVVIKIAHLRLGLDV